MMRSKVFLSYRRDDSAAYAGRLYDRLAARFGAAQVFMDIDHIEPGQDFIRVINESVRASQVLIVVIGRQWTTATDATGVRRLENSEDFVRLEVAAALDQDILVIPVLVGGASMPRTRDLPQSLLSLARRQAIEISDSRFNSDIARLIQIVEKCVDPQAGRSVASDTGVNPADDAAIASARPTAVASTRETSGVRFEHDAAGGRDDAQAAADKSHRFALRAERKATDNSAPARQAPQRWRKRNVIGALVASVVLGITMASGGFDRGHESPGPGTDPVPTTDATESSAAPAQAPAWSPGEPHSNQPHVIAGDAEGNWIPAPGYTWLNSVTGDLRVKWSPGTKHSRTHPNVAASVTEGTWKPAPGYAWVSENTSDLQVKWSPGIRHSTAFPNVLAADAEGQWQPAPGYAWLSENTGDLRVNWSPGKKHSIENPNVLAAPGEGQWEPASGYAWADVGNSQDLRVRALR